MIPVFSTNVTPNLQYLCYRIPLKSVRNDDIIRLLSVYCNQETTIIIDDNKKIDDVSVNEEITIDAMDITASGSGITTSSDSIPSEASVAQNDISAPAAPLPSTVTTTDVVMNYRPQAKNWTHLIDGNTTVLPTIPLKSPVDKRPSYHILANRTDRQAQVIYNMFKSIEGVVLDDCRVYEDFDTIRAKILRLNMKYRIPYQLLTHVTKLSPSSMSLVINGKGSPQSKSILPI